MGWQVHRLAAALLLGGCSLPAVPMNGPPRSAAGDAEYRLLEANRSGDAESARLLVALSGGGERSHLSGE